MPPAVLQAALVERVQAIPAPDGKQQMALLRLAAAHAPTKVEVARAIAALPSDVADSAALRSARGVLEPKTKPATPGR